jgi:hypothetical protein
MFESIWPKFPVYLDPVAMPLQGGNPFCILDYKLHNTAKALKSWSQNFIGSIRLQLAITK